MGKHHSDVILDTQYKSHIYIFFFKQKTAYELRISYCSSDVCSSVLSRMMARPASGMWSKPSTANASIRVLLPEPGPPVMTWKSGRSAMARTFRFRVERALAPPLPERQHIASVVALNARCTIEQRAVK